MLPNQIYATIGTIVLVLGIFLAQYIQIQHLNTDVANLNTSIAYKEGSITKLKSTIKNLNSSIGVQNEAIDVLAVDKAKAEKRLAEWKAKPAEIRYEVIYQIREVKSDDCKDIKNSINAIRSIDFNSL